jgi:AcrR family transcriptional regulator
LAGRPDFHARWVIVLKMRSSASATQERGRARRMALQDAAALLLDDPGTDIDTLVLADVCAAAGIPKSSGYHFYRDIHALYADLATRLEFDLSEALRVPDDIAGSWRMRLARYIDTATIFFEKRPHAQKLMIGPKTPPDIKRAGRAADKGHGLQLEAWLEGSIAPTPARGWPVPIYFFAIEIIDLMFGLSLLEEGRLSAVMVNQAIQTASAYLAPYLDGSSQKPGKSTRA